MKRFVTVIFLLSQLVVLAQKNWHLQDLKEGYLGISLNKAYKLLEGRKSQPVVVAVIDGGIDTNHVDLKPVLWRNPREIPNGIDDDGNGYVDDIYGWNFLGNARGENIDDEAYEVTRLYGRLRPKYETMKPEDVKPENKAEYELFKKVKAEFEEKYKKQKDEYDRALEFYTRFYRSNEALKKYFNKENFSEQEVRGLLRSEVDTLRIYAGNYLILTKNKIRLSDIENELKNLKKELQTYYNPDTNMRALIGDNPYDINDSIYGNNDVKGPSPGHGTSVAGVIGAVRTNDNDCYGIADNVRIMALRVVPGADERDKDIALAIRYAVCNGAKVINMSFGKPYSPEKEFVDEALRLADKYGVLLVHAAGNEGENNDSFPRYPMVFDKNGKRITDLWLNVGASDRYPQTNLTAFFSNYGKQTVDIFAPGVQIYSTSPGNRFNMSNGTSLAAPVVSGVAALIMSYFPELSTYEVKEILMNSSVKFKKLKVIVPTKSGFKGEDYFSNLSVSGGVVNAEKAVKLAIKMSKKKR